jgi:hypothetical protein
MEPTTEETDNEQWKAAKISRQRLAAESLNFQPGFDIPRASSSNEKTL